MSIKIFLNLSYSSYKKIFDPCWSKILSDEIQKIKFFIYEINKNKNNTSIINSCVIFNKIEFSILFY